MDQTPIYDAIIVGAGPTGLTLAIALRYRGFSVVIFEKHLTGLKFSRAVLINSETMSLLSKFDDLTLKLRRVSCLVDGVSAYSYGKLASRCKFQGKLTDHSCHPILLPQLKTEQILSEHLKNLGVTIQRGCEYVGHTLSIEANCNIVEASINDSDGNNFICRSRYLIGADGFHSSVREQLHICYPGTTMNDEMLAADVTTTAEMPTNISIWLMPAGVVLAIRLDDTHVRLAASHHSLKEQMLKLLPISSVDWMSTFKIHHHHASTLHQGQNCAIAGDAVHVHSPIGGRGLNMGVADALCLADCISSELGTTTTIATVSASGTVIGLGKDCSLSLAAYSRLRAPVTSAWVSQNKWLSYLAMSQDCFATGCRVLAGHVLLLLGRCSGSWVSWCLFRTITGIKLDDVAVHT